MLFIWLIVIAFFIGVIYFFYKIIHDSIFKANEQHTNKIKFNTDKHSVMKHISGLPFPPNSSVEIYYNENEIYFLKDKQEISIKLEKIISMDECTGKNLKSEIASGAIAGKLLIGGATGAILGSIMSTTIYFVIVYKSNDETKSLIFDTALSGTFSNSLIKMFKSKSKQDNVRIEL